MCSIYPIRGTYVHVEYVHVHAYVYIWSTYVTLIFKYMCNICTCGYMVVSCHVHLSLFCVHLGLFLILVGLFCTATCKYMVKYPYYGARMYTLIFKYMCNICTYGYMVVYPCYGARMCHVHLSLFCVHLGLFWIHVGLLCTSTCGYGYTTMIYPYYGARMYTLIFKYVCNIPHICYTYVTHILEYQHNTSSICVIYDIV